MNTKKFDVELCVSTLKPDVGPDGVLSWKRVYIQQFFCYLRVTTFMLQMYNVCVTNGDFFITKCAKSNTKCVVHIRFESVAACK